MWENVSIRVEVDGDPQKPLLWAAALHNRVGFGRTAKEALFELEQVLARAHRGEDPGTSDAAARYFEQATDGR